MSTREIAELLEKQHSNIKISAERLAEKGVIALQETPFTDPQNKQTYTEYLLNKRDSLILVAQNCPEFTARIVDRWQELEAAQAPALPSYAQALRELANKVEENERQALLIEQQRPAVEFLDRFVEAKSTKSLREVAKVLGVPERKFIKQLEDDGVLFRQSGQLLPSAEHRHAGRFEVKTGEANGHAYVQPRFTPEGIAWIAKRVAKWGGK
jgi:phage antirepressor YoqD-like protein